LRKSCFITAPSATTPTFACYIRLHFRTNLKRKKCGIIQTYSVRPEPVEGLSRKDRFDRLSANGAGKDWVPISSTHSRGAVQMSLSRNYVAAAAQLYPELAFTPHLSVI
jgi:hypothetical protein